MPESDEWKAAYILKQQKVPSEPPTLNEVVRLEALLGDFLARKGDGEPGVKTIWLGMQRILDFAAGIRFYKETRENTSHGVLKKRKMLNATEPPSFSPP